MASRSARLIIIGQSGFLLGLLVCFLLAPKLVRFAENGISNYGSLLHKSTIAPYTAAFLLGGLYSIAAGYFMPRSAPTHIAKALYILGSLYLVVLFSTYFYRHNNLLGQIHITIGTILVGFEIFIALWIIASGLNRSLISYTSLSVLLIGALLALCSLLKLLQLLFIGQAMIGIGFAALLIHTMLKIPP